MTLVSGATSGIGLAIARRLIERQHRVVALGREIEALPTEDNIAPERIDLRDLDALTVSLNAMTKKHSRVDSLVMCAGVGRFGSLEEFSYAQIRELIDVNLVGLIMIVRAFLPLLRRADDARIILIGSESARRGGRYGAVYSASKFGIRGFAQSLRYECASANVHVTLINPGMVRTAFFDDLSFAPGDGGDEAIAVADVAAVVDHVFDMRAGIVMDEINLSPLKHVVRKQPRR